MEKALMWLKENESEAIKLIPTYDIEQIAIVMQKYAEEQLKNQKCKQSKK